MDHGVPVKTYNALQNHIIVLIQQNSNPSYDTYYMRIFIFSYCLFITGLSWFFFFFFNLLIVIIKLKICSTHFN